MPTDHAEQLAAGRRTRRIDAYLSHVLDACGLTPRTVRCTRRVDPVNTMDPKLVAVAFGMGPEARNDLPRRRRQPHPIADQ